MDYYNNQDELYHYGRKGMKWGQNIFGKVKSGTSRVGKKISDAHQKKKAEKAADRLRKKPYSKLTDAELKARIQRMQLEKNLKDLDNQVDPTKEKGSKFLSSVTEAAGQALINAGKEAATKFIKDKLFNKLGLNESEFKGVHAELKKEAEKYKLEAQIATNKEIIRKKSGDSGETVTPIKATWMPLEKATKSETTKTGMDLLDAMLVDDLKGR